MQTERVQTVENRWSQDQLVSGIGFSDWMRLLNRHKFKISPIYAHRAAWITGLSIPTSMLGRVEQALYGRKVAEQPLDPAPLFLLGHWRSGTTHLHNLFGRDPAHTYSNVWQAVFPSNFLVTGKIGPKLLKNALPETRSYDAVKHGWFEAAEDEIAMIKLTGGLSFYGALMFPDDFESYVKYIDFREASDADRHKFVAALRTLTKKMMVASGGKRVIVKSCPHSARIPLLLEASPASGFVHIHRHPARVFASMMHMRAKVDWENFFQRPTKEFIDKRRDQTAELGRVLFTRLIEDRKLIPRGRLVEIAYDHLCGRELEVMRGLYEQLELPTWSTYEPILARYLDGVKDFKRNKLSLDPELQDYVYDQWRIVYDTYGYPKDAAGYL